VIELEEMQAVPLHRDEEGSVRVAGSRVTLESIVARFKQGFTGEEIQESFPSIRLGDIYAVLAYYLKHEVEVEEYLQAQREKGKGVRGLWDERPEVLTFRERIRTRRARQATS